jgi:hypothetical protein
MVTRMNVEELIKITNRNILLIKVTRSDIEGLSNNFALVAGANDKIDRCIKINC